MERKPPAVPAARRSFLTLENGDSLDTREFLRRYDAMPHLKKAELIKGRVFMGSPVRIDLHARPDNLLWVLCVPVQRLGVKSWQYFFSRRCRVVAVVRAFLHLDVR